MSTGIGKAQSSKPEPIRLDFRSVDVVVVTGADEDRFVTTSRDAAIVCRQAQDSKEWRQEFESFLGHIHKWAEDHSDVVVRCYVGVSSEGLTVVVVVKGEEPRHDFDDVITDLDIELAREYPNCRADVLQSPECPPEAMIPYLSLADSLQVYGD